MDSDNVSHYDNIVELNQPKLQKNNYDLIDQNYSFHYDQFKNINDSNNHNRNFEFINNKYYYFKIKK